MIDGATIYVTASPCWNCFKQIANAGIRRIVYGEFYRDERIFQVAERLGIELLHLPGRPADGYFGSVRGKRGSAAPDLRPRCQRSRALKLTKWITLTTL